MLTDCQAFKAAFLARCQTLGLDLGETHLLVKEAIARLEAENVKQAADPLSYIPGFQTVTDAISGTAKTVLPLASEVGLGLAIGLPVAAGAGAGYLAAKAQGLSDENPDDVKAREKIDAYRRAALRAQVQRGLRKRRATSRPSRSLLA